MKLLMITVVTTSFLAFVTAILAGNAPSALSSFALGIACLALWSRGI